MLELRYVIGCFFVLFCLVVSGCQSGGNTMDALILKNDELPENCALAMVEKESGLPFEVNANPMVSKDRSFISAFAGSVFDRKINPNHIRQSLYSVYDEKEELYVFAFEFIDTKLAKEAEEVIFYSFSDLLSLRNDRVIVVIWHDGSEHRCFKRIYNIVKQKLDNMFQTEE